VAIKKLPGLEIVNFQYCHAAATGAPCSKHVLTKIDAGCAASVLATRSSDETKSKFKP
jgi:hypothetical protein